jgi:hypothetical protein
LELKIGILRKRVLLAMEEHVAVEERVAAEERMAAEELESELYW